METLITNRSSVYLLYLYSKIESLSSPMQEEFLLFTDFLLNKSKTKADDAKTFDFDTNDNHFSELSLLSLSKEWNSLEDEEWDTILSQMPSVSSRYDRCVA